MKMDIKLIEWDRSNREEGQDWNNNDNSNNNDTFLYRIAYQYLHNFVNRVLQILKGLAFSQELWLEKICKTLINCPKKL